MAGVSTVSSVESTTKSTGSSDGAESMRSTSTRGGGHHSRNQPPPVAVEIIQKGYLSRRKRGGLLKSYEKRFYFLARRCAHLYSCKDETSFNLWLASGWALGGPDEPPASPLSPVFVCTVLHADRAGDSSDRMIAVLPSSGENCTPLKLVASSAERCESWLHSLRRVQLNRRPTQSTSSSTSSGGSASAGRDDKVRSVDESSAHSAHSNQSADRDVQDRPTATRMESGEIAATGHSKIIRVVSRENVLQPEKEPEEKSKPQPPTSAATAAYEAELHKKQQAASRKASIFDAPPPQSSESSAAWHRAVRQETSASFLSANANVTLFVPTAGSTISLSERKMAQAKDEMDKLVAQGAKRPDRSLSTAGPHVAWRYGAPEYILSDLEYIKGKTRDAETTPLESHIESCCQAFLMEATHKAKHREWDSVHHSEFYLQVNDGAHIPCHAIGENNMFGLLYMSDFALVDLATGEDGKAPSVLLNEALPGGFPMEVLQVFTQPPSCYFAWRHWGPFTGRYNGVKGDGTRIEVRGFGQMEINANRMMSLRLFYKQNDLFEQLNEVSTRLGQANRSTSSSSGRSRGVSAAPAMETKLTRSATLKPNSSTSDILSELANFTLASKK